MALPALKTSDQLKYLTENDWALLRSIAQRRSFKARELIISINSQPNALFILNTGSASVEVIRGQSIAKLKAGDICGEMAFLEGCAASASVVAETETEAEVLDVAGVHRIFELYPHVQARFYKSLALLLSQRLRATSARLAKAVAPQSY
jgi:CRP-like cAMP-binding protein